MQKIEINMNTCCDVMILASCVYFWTEILLNIYDDIMSGKGY
jgi:hypothetical protein